jgi:hypothetical protein
MSRRFWPGYTWRILAHGRTGQGQKGAHTGTSHFLSSDDYDAPVQFDELIIDHWFHLEKMSDRHWWMSVGDWHINVSIDANGTPYVSMYQNETPEEVAARRATGERAA